MTKSYPDLGPAATCILPPAVARARKKQAERAEAPVVEQSDERGIDEILGGLEQVVKELEAGDLPLEQALERFESGVRLARHGEKLLDAVEQRVEVLLADRDAKAPFDGADDPGNDDE